MRKYTSSSNYLIRNLMWWQAGVEFIRATSELLSAQYEITSAE
jgi:hypothetical protein